MPAIGINQRLPSRPTPPPRPLHLLLLILAWAWSLAALAQETPPGASVESLLEYAQARNPEYAAMRHEATAAGERVTPAGALPDPKFRAELRDLTKFGAQDPTLAPNDVGSTRYLLMQDLPWFGKRGLRRDIAASQAEDAQGRAELAWTELAARIKTGYAQLYQVHGEERLAREILDLLARLERIALARYAGGLAPQQDVIRAQLEQTDLNGALIALAKQRRQLQARMNALIARPAGLALAEPARLRPLPDPASLDPAALEARVLARNPQLASDAARIQAAEQGRALALKNRYPDFTLGVSPIQYGNAIREWELMLELNIPLQQSARRAQEREAEAMLAAARARREASANQVLADLADNLAGLDAARRDEALIATSLLPQAELAFQAALAGYENGKVDFATLLDAQRLIRQARQNRIKAQAEAQMRLAEIERVLGEAL